jgi:SAM-dependent methyltransferase
MRDNRRELDERPRLRHWSSPAIFGLTTTLAKTLRERSWGEVLDAGCGAMPYRRLIEERATSYDGLDIEQRTRGVRYVCSVTDMAPVPSRSYNTVLCSEVLEHVADPAAALAEIHRILKPGGRLLLTVPFLGRLHEEPKDYYRFTRHGLSSLLESATFRVERIEQTGSVASFLGHQASSILVAGTWHIPVVKWFVFALNAIFVVLPALALDALLKRVTRKLPLGYVVVATRRRPGTSKSEEPA